MAIYTTCTRKIKLTLFVKQSRSVLLAFPGSSIGGLGLRLDNWSIFSIGFRVILLVHVLLDIPRCYNSFDVGTMRTFTALHPLPPQPSSPAWTMNALYQPYINPYKPAINPKYIYIYEPYKSHSPIYRYINTISPVNPVKPVNPIYHIIPIYIYIYLNPQPEPYIGA